MEGLKEKLAKSAEGRSNKTEIPVLEEGDRFAEFELAKIQPDPNQPRRSMKGVEELANSIRSNGLINPIIITPVDNHSFQVVAGERRYHASKLAGLEKVPAIIRTLEARQKLEIQIIENLQRQDLDPIDEATAILRLKNEFGLTQEEVGKRLGKSKSSINELLRILTMPDKLIEKVRTFELSVPKMALVKISKEKDIDVQRNMIDRVMSGSTSIRNLTRSNELKPKPVKHRIETSVATVDVIFTSNDFSESDVVSALQKAISQFE